MATALVLVEGDVPVPVSVFSIRSHAMALVEKGEFAEAVATLRQGFYHTPDFSVSTGAEKSILRAIGVAIGVRADERFEYFLDDSREDLNAASNSEWADSANIGALAEAIDATLECFKYIRIIEANLANALLYIQLRCNPQNTPSESDYHYLESLVEC